VEIIGKEGNMSHSKAAKIGTAQIPGPMSTAERSRLRQTERQRKHLEKRQIKEESGGVIIVVEQASDFSRSLITVIIMCSVY